jgi:hypothetical protein
MEQDKHARRLVDAKPQVLSLKRVEAEGGVLQHFMKKPLASFGCD